MSGGLGKSVLGSCEFSSPPKKKLKLSKPIKFSSTSRRWEQGGEREEVQEEEEIIIRNHPRDDELIFVETRIFLPDELVTEILEWCPVKSIIGFRCVSKLWCALFRNPNFIRNHRRKQGTSKCASGDMLLLMQRLPPTPPISHSRRLPLDDFVDVLSFYSFDSPERSVRPSLCVSDNLQQHREQRQAPLNAPGNTNAFRLVGSIDGIICMKYDSRPYILCNPILREYKFLPPLLCDSPNQDYYPDMAADGFGVSYSSSTSATHLEEEDEDFKIIVMHMFLPRQGIRSPLPSVFAHLYTRKTNSWRQLGDAPAIPDMHILNSVFFRGACHWCGYTDDAEGITVILSFNMTDEVFLLLELPEWLQKPNILYQRPIIQPVVFNNCLGVVQYNNIESMSDPLEIWVMKEYGVKESWTKQFVISPLPYGTTFLPWKNDTMLLLLQQCRLLHLYQPRVEYTASARDQLASIDLHTSKMRNFEVFGDAFTLCGAIYKESLVTLN